MAVTKYLDKTGLSHFWSKIKAWANSLFALDSTVVHKTGDTMTGDLTISKNNPYFRLKASNVTKATAPSDNYTPVAIEYLDSANRRLWGIYYNYNTDKTSYVRLIANNGTTTNNTWAAIGVGYNKDGNWFTYAPTPAAADSSTNIATTAFVKAQGYLTSHQSLANYVTLDGTQTISGAKTITGGLLGTNKDSSTDDANGLYSTTVGTKLVYYTTTIGGTKLTNIPAALNTTLESRTLRRVSATDWTVEQICHNTNGLYYRLGTNSGWTAWREFAFTDSNITGNAATATKLATARTINGVSFDGSTNINISDFTRIFWSIGAYNKHASVVKGTNPSSMQYWSFGMTDKNGYADENTLGRFRTTLAANGTVSTYITAFKNEANSTAGTSMGVKYDADGTSGYTFAPTPATSDNSTKIATTEFVKAQGYLTSHQSLANYLTKLTNVSEMGRYIDLHYDNATAKYDYDVRLYCDSQGTVAGGGSFKISAATAYAPAPAADANDTRIATTKWVKDKGYLTSQTQLSLTNSGSGNAVTGISVSNHAITVTKGSTFLTSHQSLSNYVTLDSAQNITGAKRFISSIGMDFAEDYYNNNPSGNIYRSLNIKEQTQKYTMADILYGNNSGNSATWLLRLGFNASLNSFFGVYESNTDSYCITYFDIIPSSSGDFNCGRSNRKWNQVWATTGTIQTSDKRLKEDIIDIPDTVLDVWEDVSWKQFKLKESIKEKGNELARVHSGIIAQDVQELFNKVNIDCSKYGFFCYDEWDAEEAQYDDDGNLLMPSIEADNQYSVRYEEALCIEAAYQRRKNKILEKRISDLEEQLVSVLEILNNLKGA